MRRTLLIVGAMVVVAGHSATADDTATPGSRRPAYVEPPPPSILPYLGAGIALIGAAGATVFGLEARRAHRDADAHYPSDPVFATDRARFVVERAAGWSFAGIGALGVGVLVYAWLAHRDPAAVRVGLGPAAGGALVTLGGAL